MSTDQSSMGPALVGNISVDSLDDSQRLQQAQTTAELTFDATSSPVTPSGTNHQAGGDTNSFEHDTDVSFGPTIREAEEFADQMTSEILEQVQAAAGEKEEEAEETAPQYKQQPQQQEDVQQQHNNEEEEEIVRDLEERKVEFGEVGVKEEEREVQQEAQQFQPTQEEQDEKAEKKDEEEQQQQQHQRHEQQVDDSISLIKLNDSTANNELFHQTFKTAANTSQISDDKSIMEFTKNYSDDLMGSSDGQQRGAGGPDLADFELPPYSGSSSSGSEQAAATTKHSPVKQRKSSNSMATQASSSSYASGSGVASPPDLSAVKNILISAYSNVAHVFHWKRPIETGLIFTIGLILITALTFFSIISVVAYTALGCILASGVLRIYKTSMKALNRSPETPVDHIWEKVLSVDVSLSPERLHELVETSHANLNASLVYFKQVLLVEDKIATAKFFLFLYSLTYIGSWFNGLTLITIIYLALFSVPKLYESNKIKIDEFLNLATKQLSSTVDSVTSKFGGSSKKQN
uniref:Reticulon-like protein n=2 Tax=Aceria tosichella TaxID=561515 RepID=A0A6G1SIF9_9ACAR